MSTAESKPQIHTFQVIWRKVDGGDYYQQDWTGETVGKALARWRRFWKLVPEDLAEFAVIKLRTDGTYNLDL